MENETCPLNLTPGVQHYDWGGTSVIPALLGQTNPDDRPFAELWMGAHPGNPSRVSSPAGEMLGLDEWIGMNPGKILGDETAREFSGLPFLFKVLDAGKPLSIQVHPGLEQARAGFADEDARGISRQASSRNYKDENHKPELVVALGGDFWALRGFRPFDQISDLLGSHPELAKLAATFTPSSSGLKSLYETFMTDRPENVEATLRPLIDRWRRESEKAPFAKEDPRYWVLRADRLFSSPGHTDRGLLSVLLLNLVKLKPGEALFLPAGILHAYLEGTAMEIMANSDNVLRGGLTPKHVDVPELLKTVIFEGALPDVVTATGVRGAESVYRTTAAEFQLRRIDLLPGVSHTTLPAWSAEIFLVVSGSAEIGLVQNGATREWRSMGSGGCFFSPRGVSLNFRAKSKTVIFRAGVPPVRSFRGRRPTELTFGTSGLRGLISDITDIEAYVNTRGFLRYLGDKKEGARGETLSLGLDLRPSTPRIARAVAQAFHDEGVLVENVGQLPSPALLSYALGQGRASVMVTGSHIPFDRNGIKFNLKAGEVLKEDEPGILDRVLEVRSEEYNRPVGESVFDDKGFFLPNRAQALPPETPAAREAYLRRYRDFFPAQGLLGVRVLFYQHSAVGRDIITDILRGAGAAVLPVGRSEEFVPIDTEDISDDRLRDLQCMADNARGKGAPVDALVSTDGDSDRPLVCGVRSDGTLVFLPGDLLGPLVAEFLEADGVVVPVSGNDAVLEFLSGKVLPQTRIGSPFVVAGMQDAVAAGRHRVVGYEANGGFLVQSPLEKGGRTLAPLPTRDAVLPILCILFAAKERGISLVELFDRLPRRYSKAGLLDHFPPEAGRAILRSFSPSDPQVAEVDFGPDGTPSARDAAGHPRSLPEAVRGEFSQIRLRLESFFNEQSGFIGGIRWINFLDGIRMRFGNGDVVHVRPSGNAPQLRIYACASSPDRAGEIVRRGIGEPDGLLRTLQKALVKKN